jgi:hypothetical protein
LEQIIFENFKISENNIISVEMAKVLGYIPIWFVEIGLCLGAKTKTYMTNYEIVRMKALNCFEEFSLVNWHLNVIIVP